MDPRGGSYIPSYYEASSDNNARYASYYDQEQSSHEHQSSTYQQKQQQQSQQPGSNLGKRDSWESIQRNANAEQQDTSRLDDRDSFGFLEPQRNSAAGYESVSSYSAMDSRRTTATDFFDSSDPRSFAHNRGMNPVSGSRNTLTSVYQDPRYSRYGPGVDREHDEMEMMPRHSTYYDGDSEISMHQGQKNTAYEPSGDSSKSDYTMLEDTAALKGAANTNQQDTMPFAHRHVDSPSRQDPLYSHGDDMPSAYDPSSSFVDVSEDVYNSKSKEKHRFSSTTDIPLVPKDAEEGAAEGQGSQDRSNGNTTKPKRMFSILRDPKVRDQLKKRKTYRPYFLWTVSLVQVAVFIYELVKNSQLTGSPIEIHPQFNPLIGPSPPVTINVGARFDPCMRVVSQIQGMVFPCLNDTNNPATSSCSIEEICGMGGFHGGTPNQWWRFITPIFLHGGVLHIAFNLLFQLRQGADLERDIGPWRIAIIYLASGIWGFILGGNFAGAALPSTGASGALFGLIALILLDLLHNWRIVENPKRQLFILLFQIIFSFILGLLPLLDNFAHIGGFAMGLLTGIVFMPFIHFTNIHRKVIWGLRLVALPLAIALFVVLIRNFYTDNPQASCTWCVYLSCIPMSLTNYCKGLGVQTQTISTPS